MKINLRPEDKLKHRLSVRVTDRVYAELVKVANAQNRSVADVARIWINERINEEES